MEFVKKQYNDLNDNYKRLVTLAGAILLNFTVLLVFPVNILMIYTLVRAYSKNKTNLLLGMKEEGLELYEQLKNLKKADSLQTLEKDEVANLSNTNTDKKEDNVNSSVFTEDDSRKVTELTSMTEEDVAGILSSLNDSDKDVLEKDPVSKKDE